MSGDGSSTRRALRAAAALCFDSPFANRLLRGHRIRLVEEALGRGLTPSLEAPLRWLAGRELDPGDRGTVERIEKLRAGLAARESEQAPSRGGRPVSLRRVALAGSVDPRFGAFLHLAAKATRARTGLELGSAVGIGTAYLATAVSERVVSIEASPERAAIARRTVGEVSDRAEIVVGRFRRALPGALERLPAGIDVAWIDGHHRREPTLRYFEAIAPSLNEGALVAFDDIRPAAEMREAWATLAHAEGFADTIDLGPIGVGVWTGAGSPRVHDLRGIVSAPRWVTVAADRLRR